ncbi:MAG: hypothetical protein ACP5I1_14905, partial [Candidatus Hinthialibacter sp.]
MNNAHRPYEKRTPNLLIRACAVMAPLLVFLGGAYADRIEITSFRLTPERLALGEEFQVHAAAKAEGSV